MLVSLQSLSEYTIHKIMRQLNTQAREKKKKKKKKENTVSKSNLSREVTKTYKVAALAGTALKRAGPKPGKKDLKPPAA